MNPWKPAIFMAFVHSIGEVMYYYIEVEWESLRTSSHHTWGIRHLYYVKDIDRGYRLLMARR